MTEQAHIPDAESVDPDYEDLFSKTADTATFAARAGLLTLPHVNAINAADTYNYIDLPATEHIPLDDRLSSITAGYTIGAVGGIITETLARRAEMHGNNERATRIRRLGKVGTLACSLVTQIGIETSLKGVNDKWDIAAGVIATVPGLFAARDTSIESGSPEED